MRLSLDPSRDAKGTMAIYCPNCGTMAGVRPASVHSGRLVRCAGCGTSFMARIVADDRFARQPRAIAAGAAVSDAIVIDEPVAIPAVAARPALPPPPARATGGAARASARLRLTAAAAAIAVGLAAVGLAAPLLAGLPTRLAAQGMGLEFRAVRSETVTIGNASTLVVEGEIVNRSQHTVALPAVRIALKSPAGADVGAWLVEPNADHLAAGQAIGFRSARPAPPGAATQVSLSLAARG
jgi:predicted Zn finger-like uncharacterized protein